MGQRTIALEGHIHMEKFERQKWNDMTSCRSPAVVVPSLQGVQLWRRTRMVATLRELMTVTNRVW